MGEPVRWEDRTGRVRWQPRIDSGLVLAFDSWLSENGWVGNESPYPKLYRSYRCAVRKAAREQRRRDRVFQLTQENRDE